MRRPFLSYARYALTALSTQARFTVVRSYVRYLLASVAAVAFGIESN